MDMEEIFQELLLSVGISVAVCCMIMKLKPYGVEEGDGAFKRSYDGTKNMGFSGHKSDEQKLSFGYGENRGGWGFSEFFEQVSDDNFCETNVSGNGEIPSELVEDEGAVLQDLCIEKEIVGGEEICNVINDSHVVSEIIEDVSVFETSKKREEDVDGCIERLSIHEMEDNSKNPLEKPPLRLGNHEIQEYKRLGDGETENANFGEYEQVLYGDVELSQPQIEEINEISEIEDGGQSEHRGEKEEEGLFDGWEGVERTGLEKLFGTAVVFVSSKSNAGLMDRDMKILLYGLHKIAIEGPCRGAQPMALNVSARAKWDSWKKLGNMSRELAMEQYLFVLSERVPGWMGSNLPVKQSHW